MSEDVETTPMVFVPEVDLGVTCPDGPSLVTTRLIVALDVGAQPVTPVAKSGLATMTTSAAFDEAVQVKKVIPSATAKAREDKREWRFMAVSPVDPGWFTGSHSISEKYTRHGR
ncbi:hypothetical protein [Aeromicrobium sp.]|uniref:hypothetical protein n=1 Tax=Aeromicrobium sp. TaxID=1871063 RepID=UPI003C358CC1